MPAWTARAFQGSVEDIEAARTALQEDLENGIYTGHEIDLIRPAFDEPPGPPAVMNEGQATFGFAIAEGVEYDTPEGCVEVNPFIAGIVLGISGWQSDVED